MSLAKRHWPIVVAAAILWLSLVVLVALSLRRTDGHFVYALDDPYIHMALAKHLARDGVWGVGGEKFTSSSSSLLWTLLLSLVYSVFGILDASPFVLNALFATLVLVAAYVPLRSRGSPPGFTLAVLLLLLFLTPLPLLVFCGQEHVMHAALTVAFAYVAAGALSSEGARARASVALVVLAPLLVMARYEGLFLLLVVCGLFVLRRRLPYALCLGAAGILPVVVYGVVSLSRGWYFLPNPIMLKGNLPDLGSFESVASFFAFSIYREIVQVRPEILILILAALGLFIVHYEKREGLWIRDRVLLCLFVVGALLHAQFARVSSVNRYEAYLVALGIFVIGYTLSDVIPGTRWKELDARLWPKYAAVVLAIALAASPLVKRGTLSLVRIPRATANIYEQQYQMGRFLDRYYQGAAVAANDIGAVNYLADVRCIDLWGLANMEAARARLAGRYDTETIAALTRSHNVRVAIVYDHWFDELPSQWQRVGAWTIRHNVVCGGDTVSFYAVDPAAAATLRRNLSAFAPELPRRVIQEAEHMASRWAR